MLLHPIDDTALVPHTGTHTHIRTHTHIIIALGLTAKAITQHKVSAPPQEHAMMMRRRVSHGGFCTDVVGDGGGEKGEGEGRDVNNDVGVCGESERLLC